MALTEIPIELSSTPSIVDGGNATAITIDSSENVTLAGNILHAGDLTLDVAGDITLDADGDEIFFKRGGVNSGKILMASTVFSIGSEENNGDVKIIGIDGGAGITACTFDMSAAGAVTFNSTVAAANGSASAPAYRGADVNSGMFFDGGGTTCFTMNGVERARLTDNGLHIGQALGSFAAAGTTIYSTGTNNGAFNGTRDGGYILALNRLTSDGNMVEFYKNGGLKGTITVSGGTVSYNAFMASHYSETTDTELLFGTVMETTGELVEDSYSDQKRLTKTMISTTLDSAAVYGVWLSPMEHGGETIAALGASWCRISSSATVAVGDLLASNGDGTAKVQSDDIIRSKTIGKVTSTSIKETHPDGSYVVPVVLYCG